mgnify:CR=1 FL=1
MSETFKVQLEQFAKALWENYEPRMGMPGFCSEDNNGVSVDPYEADIEWEKLKEESRQWWRQLIVDCIVLEDLASREEQAGEISPDNAVHRPGEFQFIQLMPVKQVNPYRAARQFERLVRPPLAGESIELPPRDPYELNNETIRVLAEIDSLIQSQSLTDEQIGAALENIMGHCKMAAEMYPGPDAADTEEETAAFIPAPNGGEVSSAFCVACKVPMMRLDPVAVVFHKTVRPTLHTRFRCNQCLVVVVVEEDAADVRTAMHRWPPI